MAKANSETVVVAKLHRLSRDVAFVAGLMANVAELGAQRRPVHAPPLSALAENERRATSGLGLRVRFELLRLLSRRARLQVPLQAFHTVWYAEKLACYADRVCRSLLAETINFTRDLVQAFHEKLG